VSVLRTAYVNVMPKTDQFAPELTKRLRRIDAGKEGARAGESFGAKFAAAARDRMKTGLVAGLGAVGIGAGIGAGLSSGLKGALDVGAANDKLRAQLNLSKADAGRLGRAAGQLYSKGYGESIGEVNDAIKSVIQNIPSLRNASVPVLKQISAGALDIARVFDQDVGGVTAAVSSMLKSGLAPNAQVALDVISKGFQSGADKGQDLLDTFTEYSVQFTKLGLGAPQSLGVINQLLAGGARNADVAADAIKEFSIRAIDGSKTTAAGYKLLNLDADKTAAAIAKGGPAAKEAFGTVVERLNAMRDPVQRNIAGVDLFGTKWEDLGSAFQHLDVGAATDGLGKIAGATANLSTQSDSGRISAFFRTVQTGFVGVIGGQVIPVVEQFAAANKDKLQGAMTAAATIGKNVLLPAFTALGSFVAGTLVPAVASVVGWFRQHTTTAKILGATLAGVVAVIGAYQIGVKIAAAATATWTAVTKAAAIATKIWTGFQAALNLVMSINPISLIVLAIGALVAAIVVAYKNSETFRNIVQAAWQGIQTAVSFAWNNVIKPVVDALVAYFRTVIAPVALWLWNNVFKPAFAGISFAVQAAWVIIQIALKAFQLYLNNVIIPVVKFLYNNVVKPVFTAIAAVISWWWNNTAKPTFALVAAAFRVLGSALSAVWNNVIKPLFNAFGTFLTTKVKPAFDKGVEAIRKAWEKIRDAAKVPITFVVNNVVNPLIGGINKVAGFVGVKDRIPKIEGFARGGQIPGTPSLKDNRLATGPNGMLAVASGEFITNTRSTLANLPLLRAINAKQGRVSRDDIDPFLDGYERGGRIGDGLGDFFGKIINGAKGATSAILNPKKALLDVANAALARIPGAGGIVDLVRGAGGNFISSIGSWLDSKLGGAIGGSSISGGWRGMQQLIAARFPALQMISGFRPGARTLTGHQSYHALGRAVDYPPVRALAAWIKSTFGAKTKELITPWQDLNLHNGKPHTYTGAVWQQHNFEGGNAHVHWAARNGGLIARRSGIPFGSYDSGGFLPTGLSLAHNGTGRPEPVGAVARTYNITVNVPVGAHPVETGRKIVEAIKAFETSNGKRWRTT